MTPSPPIILASGSSIRADIMRGAGLNFDIIKPDVDEDLIKKAALTDHISLEKTAMMLAEAKCLKVAQDQKGIVIGSDQIMEFENRAFDKPKSMDEARDRLLGMQGKPHTLINAIAVARDGDIIWRHIDRPTLYLRSVSEEELDVYLKESGSEILHSVGGYQIEKLGSRLFEKIEGDHYAVLGLSLFPLLALLRREGVIAF